VSATRPAPEQLLGTWKLISNSLVDLDGNTRHPLGDKPQGYLTLTAEGRFVAILAGGTRKAGQSDAELAALQRSFVSYTGRFTLEPNTDDPTGWILRNRVEVAWNEAWVGTEQIRYLSLDGDILTITARPERSAFGDKIRLATIIWRRSA
jgi:hypothetical protein